MGIFVVVDDVIMVGVLMVEYLYGVYFGVWCFLVNNGDIIEDLFGIDVVLLIEIGFEDCFEVFDVVVFGSVWFLV